MNTSNKRPILERLVPWTVVKDVDADRAMPSMGATIEVRSSNGEPKTVWLPSRAWEGALWLALQTPDHYREAVAEFLDVMHSSLTTGEPLELLVSELIDEVRSDPYGKLPETPRANFDFAW